MNKQIKEKKKGGKGRKKNDDEEEEEEEEEEEDDEEKKRRPHFLGFVKELICDFLRQRLKVLSFCRLQCLIWIWK